MSELTLNFIPAEEEKVKLPIFLLSENCNLYQIIKKINGRYSLATFDGYEQYGCDDYDSITSLLDDKFYHKIVDIDINVRVPKEEIN